MIIFKFKSLFFAYIIRCVFTKDVHHKCNTLPSFKMGAVDPEPALFPFTNWMHQAKSLNDDLVYKLLNRSNDAPLGKSMTSAPLIGGVIASPLKAGMPLADLDRFDKVLRKAAGTKQVDLNVLVLGGSMTSGRMGDMVNKSQSNCFNNLPPDGYELGSSTMYWNCYSADMPIERRDEMPEGYDCKPCAFPARFESWLKMAYPRNKVRVYNRARGGMDTSSCNGQIEGLVSDIADMIDVVILNFAHNDASALNMKKKHSKVKFDQEHGKESLSKEEVASSYNKINYDADQMFLRDHELLIRTLLSFPRQPAILEMDLLYNKDASENGLFPLHAQVLQYYRIPALSWPLSGGELHGIQVQGHGSFNVHQLIADWLAYTWKRLAEHSCDSAGTTTQSSSFLLQDPKWLVEAESRFCSSSLTFMDASYISEDNQAYKHRKYKVKIDNSDQETTPMMNSEKLPGVVEGSANWVFGEDVPGKKGWWIDSLSGGKLIFPVNISTYSANIGGLGYLSSWDPAMGSVQLSIIGDPPDRYMVINGSNSGSMHKGHVTHVSISKYSPLCVPPSSTLNTVESINFALPTCGVHHSPSQDEGYSTRLLQVELIPRPLAHRNKFVIRYITTC